MPSAEQIKTTVSLLRKPAHNLQYLRRAVLYLYTHAVGELRSRATVLASGGVFDTLYQRMVPPRPPSGRFHRLLSSFVNNSSAAPHCCCLLSVSANSQNCSRKRRSTFDEPVLRTSTSHQRPPAGKIRPFSLSYPHDIRNS